MKTNYLGKADNQENKKLTFNDIGLKFEGKKINIVGIPSKEISNWVDKNHLALGDPESNGDYEGFNTWVTPFDRGYISWSDVNDIMMKRIGYDDSYISLVSFSDRKIMTLRGVSVGDDQSLVIDKYGKADEPRIEKGCDKYHFFDMGIRFCFDENQRVKNISFYEFPVGEAK